MIKKKGEFSMAFVKTEFKIYYETTVSGVFESLVHPTSFETLAEARAFTQALMEEETTLGATIVESIVRDEEGNSVLIDD